MDLDADTNEYLRVDMREWQLERGHDFRSALTNPLLHSAETGNFHLQSEYGRYNPATDAFVTDAETSWAIGRGNPNSPFDEQPDPTAGRINLGAFGNTEFASMGSTNPMTMVRTLNDGMTISNITQQVQPLVWAMNNVPTNLLVAVQYSPDGGTTWVTIQDNVDAYQEYIVWTATPEFEAYGARWRVIGDDGVTIYAGTNASPFDVLFQEFDGIDQQLLRSGRHTIRWRGAMAEDYRVEYTEDGFDWFVAPDGPGADQNAVIIHSPTGGNIFYEDIDSTNIRFRSYRVIWDRDLP